VETDVQPIYNVVSVISERMCMSVFGMKYAVHVSLLLYSKHFFVLINIYRNVHKNTCTVADTVVRQTLMELPSIKFHENSLSRSPVVTCGQVYRATLLQNLPEFQTRLL
jgi:hypothetical protein